jgi:hypothetical protein
LWEGGGGPIIEHANGWVVVDDSVDVFEALAENRRIRLDAELRELVLIAQACDEYTEDEDAAWGAAAKLIVGGAPGTALVGEFLALELADLLQISPTSAVCRIGETPRGDICHPPVAERVSTQVW